MFPAAYLKTVDRVGRTADYRRWLAAVRSNGWTMADVRCDVPPTESLFAAMAEWGLDNWELFALAAERRGDLS